MSAVALWVASLAVFVFGAWLRTSVARSSDAEIQETIARREVGHLIDVTSVRAAGLRFSGFLLALSVLLCFLALLA